MHRHSSLALLLFSPFSLASLSNVSDVIVVNSTMPNQQAMTSTSLSISKEMMEVQGSLNLADVLQNTPGIQLRYGGQGVPQLDIRGYKSRHITFLVNGVPQNNAWNSQFDPQLIPVEQIERVDIIKGGSGSLLYGAGGFGGVINVITHGQYTPKTRVSLGAGNGEHYNLSGSTSGITDSLGYTASYVFDSRNGFPMSSHFDPLNHQGKGLRENSDSKSHAISTSLNWQATELTQLGLNIDFHRDNWGVPDKLNRGGNGSGNGGGNGSGNNVVHNALVPTNNNTKQNNKYQRVNPSEHYNIQTTFDTQLTDTNTLRGYTWYSRETRDIHYKHYAFPGDQRTVSQSYGGNLQWVYSQENYTVTNGLRIFQDNWRCTGECGTENQHRTIDQQEWVVEYQYHPVKTYGIAVGGGGYHNNPAHSVDYAGQISAFWYPTEDTCLYSSASHRIRYPDLRQLYETEFGNSSLKPETSNYYEIGLEQLILTDLQLHLSLYSSDIYDYIEKATTDSGERYENFDHYRFQGIETDLSYFITDGIDVTVGYSWLKAKNKGNDNSKSALQGRPKHSVAIGLNADLPLDMHASIQAQSFWDSVQYQGKTQTPVKLDNYQLVDFSLSGISPWKPVTWQFTVKNLFDKDYEQALNFPRPGREWFFQVKTEF
ncbi:TonB-dependent receptor [Providencia sp. R33]|uniref:TonB-dependent receptor n=1 Tax=Providencia sp. R33 TaxID=2828763 RepID=UPI001C5B28DE|nr:TonB-dependent receptor [Providencia sp. R33]